MDRIPLELLWNISKYISIPQLKNLKLTSKGLRLAFKKDLFKLQSNISLLKKGLVR